MLAVGSREPFMLEFQNYRNERVEGLPMSSILNLILVYAASLAWTLYQNVEMRLSHNLLLQAWPIENKSLFELKQDRIDSQSEFEKR